MVWYEQFLLLREQDYKNCSDIIEERRELSISDSGELYNESDGGSEYGNDSDLYGRLEPVDFGLWIEMNQAERFDANDYREELSVSESGDWDGGCEYVSDCESETSCTSDSDATFVESLVHDFLPCLAEIQSLPTTFLPLYTELSPLPTSPLSDTTYLSAFVDEFNEMYSDFSDLPSVQNKCFSESTFIYEDYISMAELFIDTAPLETTPITAPLTTQKH